VTGAALRMTRHHFFVAGAVLSTAKQLNWKKRKTHWYEAVSSALNFPFLKEVSQNCFVFDCQIQKLKKSRRIASFWMLSSSKNEEVSQSCFVFDVFLMLSTSKNEEVSQQSFVFKLADR